jgi:hypothetical protein
MPARIRARDWTPCREFLDEDGNFITCESIMPGSISTPAAASSALSGH